MSQTIQKDFYIDQQWLASYFEKEWFDHVSKSDTKLSFAFPAFGKEFLYSDYNEKLIQFLKFELQKVNVKPRHLLEIGSALGRTYFEICKNIPSIKTATLVEPSQNLFKTFKKIFESNASELYPVLIGNKELSEVSFNTQDIQKDCSSVDYTLINLPFTDLSEDLPKSELVICSNVIDQCDNPFKLIEFLKSKVSDSGILALSCTYQWNEKFVGTFDYPNYPIKNINDFFTDDWTILNQTDIPFSCRRNERYWVTFLSHVSIFRRKI